ncbi:hypothetical protein EAH_00019350 [Eimeria acervulina]|uniref:Transmembrane protein n=1 Tax=Eimeria acervulina TaxID=5801 RepID=U6GBM4_EIMAC|nr:hypothetical protein EAH_00019350 [Eimeria acervulina]CDI76738.1 hypothetical protein EAH_00019350 [Eimeria acervulina]
MPEQTEIASSIPFGAAPVGSTDGDPLPRGSRDEALEEWGTQANASAVHPVAKRPFGRLNWNLQLTPLLLVAALTVAFVLLRCYRQLTVLNSPRKGPLRSLAEEEGSGRETLCQKADLASFQSPAGASGDNEAALQRRCEEVLLRLTKVTKDCASVAVLMPPDYSFTVVYLFLGACIQEASALSELLRGNLDQRKVEVLEGARDAAKYVFRLCGQLVGPGKRTHAYHLIKYAEELRDTPPESPLLPTAVRIQIIKDLLMLQETALELLEKLLSSVFTSSQPIDRLSTEAAHEIVEELKRIVYTRRQQLFTSKHLSHTLRCLEAKRTRGRLMPGLHNGNQDEPRRRPLDEQLDDLKHGRRWVKTPLQTQGETKGAFEDTPPKNGGCPPQQCQPQGKGMNTRSGFHAKRRGPPRSGVPPRFANIGGGAGWRPPEEQAQESALTTGTSHTQEAEQTTGNPSPSHKRLSYPGTQDMPSQALATTSPPGPPLPTLGKSLSALSLSSPPSQDGHPSYGLLTSSVATSPQPPEPAAEEKWKAPGWRGHGATRSAAPTPESWSPWSNSWAPNVLFWPQLTTSGSTSATTASVGHSQEGVSSSQTSQQRLPDPH